MTDLERWQILAWAICLGLVVAAALVLVAGWRRRDLNPARWLIAGGLFVLAAFGTWFSAYYIDQLTPRLY